MNINGKPFACTEAGCGMCFTNEDHLSVHRKKHEMCLSLPGMSSQKSNVIMADQTPTPTRFIRNCEEIGLFQDLQNVNPFDEQFRKAAQQPVSNINETSLLLQQEQNDSLNTPAVFPVNLSNEESECNIKLAANGAEITRPSDSSSTAVSSSNDVELSTSKYKELPVSISNTVSLPGKNSSICDPSISTSNVITSKPAADENNAIGSEISHQSKSEMENKNSHLISSNKQTISMAQPILLHIPDSTVLNPNPILIQNQPIIKVTESSSSNCEIQRNISDICGNVMNANRQVFDTNSNVTNANSNIIIKQNTLKNILPQTIVVKNDSNISNVTMRSQNVQSSQQLLVKLEDGSTFPLQIPPSILASNAATVAPATAKQKLKEVLCQNQIVGGETVSSSQNVIPEVVTDHIFTDQPSSKIRRRSSDDDPVEKRQKFLERNRAAATRCRLKRKSWIHSLELKAQQFNNKNLQLQKEVNDLRKEVSYLKSMLLAHKDCPVTLQQIQEHNQNRDFEAASSLNLADKNDTSGEKIYFVIDSNSQLSTDNETSASPQKQVEIVLSTDSSSPS